MAIIHIDGFDHYGTDETFLTEGPYFSEDVDLFETNQRTGSGCFRINGTGSLTFPLPATKTSVGAAIAFNPLNFGSGTTRNAGLLVFVDGSGNEMLSVSVNNQGALLVILGDYNDGTYIYEGPSGVFSAGSYRHIEAFVEFDNSSGSVVVYLDGQEVVNETGIDTIAAGASSPCAAVRQGRAIGFGGTDVSGYFDDYIVYDDTGSLNTGPVGDLSVETLYPSADVTQSSGAVSTASEFYTEINEDTPDDDTSYVQLAGAGDEAVFEVENLSSTDVAIAAVAVQVRARKTSASASSLTAGLGDGGSNENTSSTFSLSETYTGSQQVFNAGPDGTSPWTVSDFQDVELTLAKDT